MRRYYLLIGDRASWEISLNKKMWGFSQNSKGLWNTTEINDFLAFYVTNPIKKVIGFGEVIDKMINEDLIWPDEILFKRSIWKKKIRFDIFQVTKTWNDGIKITPRIMLNVGRRTITQEMFEDLVKQADSKWKTSIHKRIFS